MSTSTSTHTSGGRLPRPCDPVARVIDAHRRLDEADRPEVWTTLRDRDDALALARGVRARLDDEGDGALPLAGLVLAVKDNVDVAGLPTTCAAPATAYVPEVSATVVARLEAAGAIVLGKTNLDQFATGLVGTRSPYGAVRAVHDPLLVSGGSSSGSAVATALGIVDAALGTDTAGSGRVPAAFNRLVGLKPTLGLLPTRGVVPAAPSYDAVSVFARDLAAAQRVAAVAGGVDPDDPTSRAWDACAPVAAPDDVRLAVPRDDDLTALTPSYRASWDLTVAGLRRAGAVLVESDVSPLLDAARLLYDGALVAERTHAVGHLLDLGPVDADPSVTAIVRGGADKGAVELVADQQALRRAALRARRLLAGVDALLLPTAPGHPSIEDVAADPLRVNSWVGTYTNFVNLLDLAALAVPGAEADGAPFGVTLVGRAFSDAVLADVAGRLFLGEPDTRSDWEPPTVDLVVVGAHLAGQPLNGQLVDLGAALVGPVTTAPRYRLHALDTTPPKPGLVRVREGGACIEGERWSVPAGLVGAFLTQLAAPMTIGLVELDGGERVLGFLCEPDAVLDAVDVTAAGSWRRHLARRPFPGPGGRSRSLDVEPPGSPGLAGEVRHA